MEVIGKDCVGCGKPWSKLRIEYPESSGPWCKACFEVQRKRIKDNLDAWANQEILVHEGKRGHKR